MIIIVAFTFLFQFSPSVSYACDCAIPENVNEEVGRSSAVFSGTVVRIFDENKSKLTQSSADPISVVIEVDETWKGINQTEVIVNTERDEASCGFEFVLNETYLIYANEDNGELRASYCSRTALFSDAQEDLNELGVGEKPTEVVTVSTNATSDILSSTNTTIYIVLFIVIAILTVVYSIVRKKKRNHGQ